MVMDYDLATLIETGLDTVTGIGFTGTEEKYIAAVQRIMKRTVQKFRSSMKQRTMKTIV